MEVLDQEHQALKKRLDDIAEANGDVDFSEWEETFVEDLIKKLRLQGNRLSISDKQEDALDRLEKKIERAYR